MEAFFLAAAQGSRFCVHHVPREPQGAHATPGHDRPAAPHSTARGLGLVALPAFAEEMNKSRHVVAQAARALAAGGAGVLTIDLLGCGDSSGSLADATWDDWLADARLALDWMRAQGYGPLWLWGTRVGALLAAEVAQQPDAGVAGCLFWQPVTSGETALVQFLRLRAAGAMIAGKPPQGESVRDLRSRLAAGETIDIAGYPLPPALAGRLAATELAALRPACKVQWIEIVADAGRGPGAGSTQVIAAWQAQGLQVGTELLAAEPFWAATNAAELVQCPAIVSATAAGLHSWLG